MMMCAHDPTNVFTYMGFNVTLFGTALTGYSVDTIYWEYVRAALFPPREEGGLRGAVPAWSRA